MNDSTSARSDAKDYTPAAPRLWMYDFLSDVLASASRWRPILLRADGAPSGDVIADVGAAPALN